MTPALATAPPLFDRLSEIAPALNAAACIYLFLDFDGTLAPIVEDPDAAFMSPQCLKHLASLARRARFHVALISGRSLTDLRQRVGLEDLTYAGNHGLEIRGPGLSFVEPSAATQGDILRELLRGLTIRLRGIGGIRIENKVLTGSVHYRKAWVGHREEIRRIVAETVDSASNLFQITEGLEVLEIRPLVNWNKGSAVRWILASQGGMMALPVYLGDDATDEDAFSALASGITVRVGQPERTVAKYRLEQQDSVEEFLVWLGDLDDRRNKG